jgi:uncharacterized protein (TIGR02118 family)
MVKVTALYGPPADPAAFERHYADAHMPLVYKIPGLGRIEEARVIGTPDGSPAPYHRLFEFWFDGPEQMQAALGSPEGQAAVADLANFATGGVTIVVSEVD